MRVAVESEDLLELARMRSAGDDDLAGLDVVVAHLAWLQWGRYPR